MVLEFGCTSESARSSDEGVILPPDSVPLAGGRFLKSRERIGEYAVHDEQVYCGELGCGAPAMANVDMSTFRVFRDGNYAMDGHAVYYPFSITCVDRSDCGVCYCDEYIVEGADVSSFEYIDNEYAKDSRNAYFRGNRIPGADPKSFRNISGPEHCFFAKDDRSVFMYADPLAGLDPRSFYVTQTDKGDVVLGDSSRAWRYEPPKTLTPL
jgi:hypothetical protein